MPQGRPPKVTALKAVAGNPGDRRLPENEPETRGSPEKPSYLHGFPEELWDEWIATAWWLGRHDSPKCFMWCVLQAEFIKDPSIMPAARLTQLRQLGGELGFDPTSRARMGQAPNKSPNGNDKYF